jgi:hypothetical protein
MKIPIAYTKRKKEAFNIIQTTSKKIFIPIPNIFLPIVKSEVKKRTFFAAAAMMGINIKNCGCKSGRTYNKKKFPL